jgi:DNA-binding IclR family transcriptional regulator
MDSGNGTESAARVADVLLHFLAGNETLGVSALGRDLGLSKAVVHRIARTLVDRDLLAVDHRTRGYRLGPAAAALGARALRDSQLRTTALPALRELQVASGETTTLSALVADGRVYVDQIVSRHEIKMTVEVGRRFPLHAGSSGRAILAFLPAAERARIISAGLEAMTPNTVVDPESLDAVLVSVRELGVARSDGERQPGAASVASPVFDVDGRVVGAISVCGPHARLTDKVRNNLVPDVIATADRISRELGWSGALPAHESAG